MRGATSEGYPEEWDLDQLWTALRTLYPVSVTRSRTRTGAPALTSDELVEELCEDAAGRLRPARGVAGH